MEERTQADYLLGMSTFLTLSKLVRTPIDGHCYSHGYLSKIRDNYHIQSKGKGPKQANVYDPEDFRKAIEQDKGSNGDATMAELKEKKIRKEIDLLERDLQQKDIQIKKLKDTLIDSDELLEYLTRLKTAWAGALKQVLLTQMPVEVPGMDVTKARETAERYYNKVMGLVTSPTVYETA